jgi:plastocyanin
MQAHSHGKDGVSRLLSATIAIIALTLLASCALGLYPPRHRTHDVRISNFAFAPDELTITAGDIVRWSVAAGTHSATSGAGIWDSPDLVAGKVFEERFDQPGAYSYHCRIHSFMHARILVVPVAPFRAATFWCAAALGACAALALALRRRRAHRA